MPAVTTTNPNTPQQPPAPATQQPQPANLPYTSNNGTLMPVVPAPKQPVTQPDLQQGSNQVMAAAQQTAINKANQPNAIMGDVQGGVVELLKNPMGKNYNSQKVNQNQLEQFDRNRAQSMMAFQQQNADTSNTGVNREAAYNFAMQGAQGRSDLESKLTSETAERERLALLDALKLGASTSQTQSGLDTEAFNRLIAARGAYEGEAGRALQEKLSMADLNQKETQFAAQMKQSGQQFTDELAFKKYATDAGLTDNEAQRVWSATESEKARTFTGSQASLDRAQQLLLQNNDQQGQRDLAELNGKITTGQLLTANDFKASQAALDRAQQTALQSNDITAQQNITRLKAELDQQAQEAQRKFESGESALDRAQQLLLQSNDLAGQKDITSLQGQIRAGELLTQNDFTAAQASLDRAQQTALQNNDIAAQKEITNLKASLDLAAQNAQNTFNKELTTATQSWQSGERLGAENYDRTMKALDRELEITKQQNDIYATNAIEDNRAKLQLAMQVNEMGQEERMAYLNANLAEARANNDVGRQQQIISFQTAQDITKIVQQQGFEAAEAELDRRAETAKQDKDIVAQREIQSAQIALQRDQMAQDRILADADRQLREKGLNADILQQQYNQIKDASGPDAAAEYLRDELGRQGVSVPAPDPLAAQKALESDYNNAAVQYALSHPDQMIRNDDGSISLSPEGQSAFFTWYNDNIYGNAAIDQYRTGEKDPTLLTGKTSDPDYIALKNSTSQYTAGESLSTGQYTRIGNDLMYVKEHTPGTSMTVINLATGKTYNSTTFSEAYKAYFEQTPEQKAANEAADAAASDLVKRQQDRNVNSALDIVTGGIYGGLKSIFKW